MVAQGDKVAVRHRFRGTQSGALGPYLPIHRVYDCRIADALAGGDQLSSLRRLGHLDAV